MSDSSSSSASASGLPLSVVSPASVSRPGLVLGFAVRDEKIVAVGGQGFDLFLTSTDGKTFNEGRSSGRGLRGACIRKNGEVWVIGEYGYLAKSSDFGGTWEVVPTKTKGCLFGVVEDDDDQMWFGGDGKWLALSTNGTTLKRIKGVDESIARMRNSPLGVLIPTDTSESEGYLYIARGKSVTKTSAAPKAGMMQAVVTPKGTLIAVGMNGAILRSTDAGESFEEISLPSGVSPVMLTNVDHFADGRVVVVGDRGLILLSQDDGASFERIEQHESSGTLWSCARYGDAMLIGGQRSLIMMLGELKAPPTARPSASQATAVSAASSASSSTEAPAVPANPAWAAPPPSTARQAWSPPPPAPLEIVSGIYVTPEFRSLLYPRRGGIATPIRPLPSLEEAWGELRRLLWAADRTGMNIKSRPSGIWDYVTTTSPKTRRLIGERLLDVAPRAGTFEEDVALVSLTFERYQTFIADFHDAIYDATADFLVASVGLDEAIKRCYRGLDDELPYTSVGPFGRLRELLAIASDGAYTSARKTILTTCDEEAANPDNDRDRTADIFWTTTFLLPLDENEGASDERAAIHEKALGFVTKFGSFGVHACGLGAGNLDTLARYVKANNNETRHEFFSPFNGRMYLASILELEGAAAGPAFARLKPSSPWENDEGKNTIWCRLIAHIDHDDVLSALHREHEQEGRVWGTTGLILAARANPERVLAFAKKKNDKNLLALLESELSRPAPPFARPRVTPPEELTTPIPYTPPKAPVVIEVPASLEPEAEWRDEEIAIAQDSGIYDDAVKIDDVSLRKATPEMLERWIAHREKWAIPSTIEDFALAPRALHPRLLKLGFSLHSYWVDHGLLGVMYKDGLELLPLLRAALQSESWESALVAAQPFGDVAFVPAIARAFGGKKNKSVARTWMLRHPRHAIAGALDLAFAAAPSSKKDKDALDDDARRMLRYLDGRGHRASILELASARGKDRASVLAMLDMDPLDAPKVKKPVLPKWLSPSDLPPLVPAKSAPKSDASAGDVTTLLVQLAFSNADEVHPGVTRAKSLYTPESRAAFAWNLFETWLAKGADAKQIWCMHTVGFLGDDECARKLTALAKAWPGENASARAQAALDTLLNIGTDSALMNINLLAEKSKFPAFKAGARERIDTIAYARGLTADELADRLVPTLGLEEDGANKLDFGARSFEIVFGEDLLPKVKDADGKLHADLPKPNKSDDKDLAKVAKTRLSALKKDARMTASLQIARMERAMRTMRPIAGSVFLTCFATHPWMSHLARRFVWGAFPSQDAFASFSGGGASKTAIKTFRVAEDGSLADIEDQPFTLTPESVVVLLHPLAIAREERERWGQIFGDYEILQPFPQLARPVFTVDEGERKAKALERFSGRKVGYSALRGLESRGWERWNDDVVQMVRRLGAKTWAVLHTEPGWHPSQTVDDIEPQSIERLQLHSSGASGEDGFGALSPLVFSELVYDLETIAPA